MKIGLVSLGCPKNLVDSEVMLGLAQNAGHELTPDPADADVLVHLDRLPTKARVVVRLRFVEDLSQQEIAEALEIPLGTVKSRLAYGLERLRALLRTASEPDAAATVGTTSDRMPAP